MQVQITFREIPSSEALEAKVRERADKLAKLHDQIISCHVTVDAPHRHQHRGRTFRVTVDLLLPECAIVVSRDPGLDGSHQDAYVAVRDAFDTVTRRLQDYVARRREPTARSA